jgi:nitrate reductase alpha subunit
LSNDPPSALRILRYSKRGLGGFVRANWDEVTEIIAAANAYTIRQSRP